MIIEYEKGSDWNLRDIEGSIREDGDYILVIDSSDNIILRLRKDKLIAIHYYDKGEQHDRNDK